LLLFALPAFLGVDST